MSYLDFQELDVAQRYVAPLGRLHVKANRPCAVFGYVEGVEVLVGTGTEVKVYSTEITEFFVEAQDGGKLRAFLFNPEREPIETKGEIFTNMDRQPLVSGHMAELAKEMRKFRLEQMAVLKQSRAELAAIERRKQATAQAEADPEPEKPAEKEPEPDPEKEKGKEGSDKGEKNQG